MKRARQRSNSGWEGEKGKEMDGSPHSPVKRRREITTKRPDELLSSSPPCFFSSWPFYASFLSEKSMAESRKRKEETGERRRPPLPSFFAAVVDGVGQGERKEKGLLRTGPLSHSLPPLRPLLRESRFESSFSILTIIPCARSTIRLLFLLFLVCASVLSGKKRKVEGEKGVRRKRGTFLILETQIGLLRGRRACV